MVFVESRGLCEKMSDDEGDLVVLNIDDQIGNSDSSEEEMIRPKKVSKGTKPKKKAGKSNVLDLSEKPKKVFIVETGNIYSICDRRSKKPKEMNPKMRRTSVSSLSRRRRTTIITGNPKRMNWTSIPSITIMPIAKST